MTAPAAFDPTDRLKRIAPRAARMALGPGAKVASVNLRLRHRAEDRFVALFEAGEDRAAVKVFDMARPSAAAGFEREVTVLKAVRGRGLGPALRGWSAADGFLVSDWIDGPTLEEAIARPDPAPLFERLGAWFGRFALVMAGEPVDTDWLSYLRQYEAFGAAAALAPHAGFLRRIPITRRTIAKNDAHLGNFIVSDRGLTGIDYEAAALKPAWWDLLLTARSLARRRPDLVEAIPAALARGWRRVTPGDDAAAMTRLMLIFIHNTAFAVAGDAPGETADG